MQPQQFVNTNGGFYNPQPSQPFEFFHELDSKFKSQIQGLIPTTEQIFYSGMIDKINKNMVSQKRILVITNRYLYNIRPEGEGLFASIIPPLSGARVQRKIDVSSIFAVSLSVRSQGNKNQFVLHVAGQYDYRYNGGENTEKIIKTIANIYNAAHNAPFIIYFIEETDLGRFHTTDDDLSMSVSKRPRDGKVLVTTEIMQKGLSWIIANRFSILQAQEAQKPQLKQADTLVQVKQQLYTNVPLGGGNVIQVVKPTIVVPVPTIKIEQRPVTTIVYNPPVNVVTVGTTKVINLTNGIQTTTTTMPYQQVVQTTNLRPYQQQMVQQNYNQPPQNIYNQPGNMQNQYVPMNQQQQQQNYNNNNQYGGNNYNNNNIGNHNNTQNTQNNQNNLNDLIGVSQQNVTINSNFENKNNNKPF